MDEFWEELLYSQMNKHLNSAAIDKITRELETSKKRLKANLSKKQRRLLLRIEDAKDLIKCESNKDSFAAGFKLGLKIGYETNRTE